MRNKDPILILFAKKPELGKVKTRLCPPLSDTQAKDVAIFLIQKSVEKICSHWPGHIELSLWPDSKDNMLAELSSRWCIELSTQAHGNLGEKMQHAMHEKLSLGHNTLIMGADVPHCGREIFQTAYLALKAGKNVIGPTYDGGYYCIGVDKSDAAMFDQVRWGGDNVYRQTLASCAEAGICFDCILPSLNDLDTFDDLKRISQQLPELRKFIDDRQN